MLPLARASENIGAAGVRVAAFALVLLVAVLVHGWPRLVPLSLLGLGGIYAAQLAVDDRSLDAAVPVLAVGLYVTTELAYWSLEEREPITTDRGESLRRVALIAGLALGMLVLTATLLALVDTVRARGLAIDLVGAAGAAGVLLAVVLLARGRRRIGR